MRGVRPGPLGLGENQKEFELAVVLRGDEAAQARVLDVPVREDHRDVPATSICAPLRSAVSVNVTGRVVPRSVRSPCAL